MSQRGSYVRDLVKREFHLDAIAYTIIIVLLALTSLLTFMLFSNVSLPDMWLLESHVFRTLLTGFLFMLILYLIDQHNRLRTDLVDTHDSLEKARTEIQAACERLSFAQRAAETMTSLEQEDALERVLRESCKHFGAEAAAVVGDDVTLFTEEGVDDAEAHSAILQVTLDAVRVGKPLSISNPKTGCKALATPLRIRGELKSVACLWRRGEPFAEDQLEGLSLIARIIELSIENSLLLAEVNQRLTGTLKALAELIDRRITDYSRRSTLMAEHAVAVAKEMGLTKREVADVRIAAMMIDVGMLEVSESVLNARRALTPEEVAEIRMHPTKGAEVARTASFDPEVQHAIQDHHERLNGSGYPAGHRGDEIDVPARILAVCEVFNSMTTDRPHRPRLNPEEAIAELTGGMGTLYDSRVVRAFLDVVDYRQASALDPVSPEFHSANPVHDMIDVADFN